MPAAIRLSLTDARRIAVRGQGLAEPQPRSIVEVVRAQLALHTLLSPFDKLVYDRDRTEELFGFRFRLEIYVPKAKREYGYYVLPVLHGDRLVGRIDAFFDRKDGVLRINAVYWEDGPVDIDEPVASLAQWLATGEVAWP